MKRSTRACLAVAAIMVGIGLSVVSSSCQPNVSPPPTQRQIRMGSGPHEGEIYVEFFSGGQRVASGFASEEQATELHEYWRGETLKSW